MKRNIVIVAVIMLIVIMSFMFISLVNAADNQAVENETSDKAIDDETESKLVEIKDNVAHSLDDYKEKYGSDVYGTVAYILNMVRIYSIPLCFLGIAIGAIHQYVIGVRKLDTLEKGMALIVTFITILIICQILPLAFAVFVKFGRGVTNESPICCK